MSASSGTSRSALDADVDVFGETADELIRFAEAGAALEIKTDGIVRSSVEQEVKHPADIKVLFYVRGLRLQMGGNGLVECPALVDARAKDFNERLLHGSPSLVRDSVVFALILGEEFARDRLDQRVHPCGDRIDVVT